MTGPSDGSGLSDAFYINAAMLIAKEQVTLLCHPNMKGIERMSLITSLKILWFQGVCGVAHPG